MAERDAPWPPAAEADGDAEPIVAAMEPERLRLPERPEVPEADALEQAEEVEPGPRRGDPALGFEVPEADAWEQAIEVPVDEEHGAEA